MGTRHLELMRKAIQRNGRDIKLCGGKTSLADCFTEYNGRLIFWFDDSMGSTKCIVEEPV